MKTSDPDQKIADEKGKARMKSLLLAMGGVTIALAILMYFNMGVVADYVGGQDEAFALTLAVGGVGVADIIMALTIFRSNKKV